MKRWTRFPEIMALAIMVLWTFQPIVQAQTTPEVYTARFH